VRSARSSGVWVIVTVCGLLVMENEVSCTYPVNWKEDLDRLTAYCDRKKHLYEFVRKGYMRNTKVKKIRREIKRYSASYQDQMAKEAFDVAISALFVLPLFRRFKFALGLIFLPLWSLWTKKNA
jgi:hypothetical protein